MAVQRAMKTALQKTYQRLAITRPTVVRINDYYYTIAPEMMVA